MIRKLSIIVLLITVQVMKAQVTVNQLPDLGEVFAIDALSYGEIDFNTQVKPTGGNQSWDFSNVTSLGFPDTAYYLPPGIFNTGAQATGANLAIFDNTSLLAALTYHTVTPTEQRIIAYTDDDTTLVKMETPYLVNKFPLNYLDELGDMSKFNIPTQLGDIKTEIENFSKVDSWGEIKTPMGTYACLRVKTVTTLQGSLFGIPFFNATINEYKWISPGFDYELLRYSVAETEFNNEISNDTFSIYLFDQIISKTKNPGKPLSVSIGPNPAYESIWITIPDERENKKILIEIFDISANKVFEQVIQGKSQEINVKHWERGTYMLKASEETNQWALQKLILQ